MKRHASILFTGLKWFSLEVFLVIAFLLVVSKIDQHKGWEAFTDGIMAVIGAASLVVLVYIIGEAILNWEEAQKPKG